MNGEPIGAGNGHPTFEEAIASVDDWLLKHRALTDQIRLEVQRCRSEVPHSGQSHRPNEEEHRAASD